MLLEELASNSPSRPLDNSHITTGLQDRVSRTSTSQSSSNNRFNSSKFHQISSHVRSHKHSSRKKSDRGSVRQLSRLLFEVLSGTKERFQQMEGHSGSITAESVCHQGEIQNGNGGVHTGSSQRWTMGNICRPIRCVSSCANTFQSQKVPQISVSRQNIPVQSISHGLNFIPKNFYQTHQMPTPVPPVTLGSCSPVPRRLADIRPNQTGGRKEHRDVVVHNREIRFPSKPREVRTSTCTGDNISLISFPPRIRQDNPHGGTMGEASTEDSSFSAPTVLHSTPVAIATGTSYCNREDCTVRNVAHSIHPNSPARSVVAFQGRSTVSSVHQSPGQGSTEMVDEQRLCDGRSANSFSSTRVSDIHRFQYDRLGRNLSRYRCQGGLDTGGKGISYQRSRTVGCVESTSDVQTRARRVSGDGSLGQYDSSGVYQEAGRNEVQEPHGGNTTTLQLAGTASNSLEMSPYPGSSECVSRFSVKRRSDSGHRVDDSSEDFGISVDGLGETHDRPIRHEAQLQVTNVCVSGSRQDGMASRRSLHDMGQSTRLRFSSNGHSSKSPSKVTAASMQDDSDSPVLAKATVVHNIDRNASGLSTRTSQMGPATQATPIRHLSQEAGGVQLTRLEIVQRAHRNRGFSNKVATRMSQPQKQSSLKVYQGKWKLFCDWCQERDLDPLSISNLQVADFLVHLHEDRHLAPSTIEGYRTAISNTIKPVSGLDLGKDQHLSNLLANFQRDTTRERSSAPPWDLSLVLRKLTEEPFEPMHRASLKHATLKTVFLVALASGKRRSEIHAMRKEILHTEHWRSVSIVPDPMFVAKTQLNNRGSAMLNVVTIKSLTQELPEDLQQDRSLCPVRALKYYTKMADKVRSEQKKLFIAYKKGHTDEIHMNTISAWLKKTILMAYENTTEEDLQITRVKAHQVRSLAASWALHSNASIDDIMSACSWRSHNTFTQYYLKDMALIRDEMYHLGPVLAASHIS